jgi:hypothetical protein
MQIVVLKMQLLLRVCLCVASGLIPLLARLLSVGYFVLQILLQSVLASCVIAMV